MVLRYFSESPTNTPDTPRVKKSKNVETTQKEFASVFLAVQKKIDVRFPFPPKAPKPKPQLGIRKFGTQGQNCACQIPNKEIFQAKKGRISR
jgi:hypothetical protein